MVFWRKIIIVGSADNYFFCKCVYMHIFLTIKIEDSTLKLYFLLWEMLLFRTTLGRSVPGARGAQHTTNMAAALSKLPLRTISTIRSFPWLLPVGVLKIGRFGSNSFENTHSVEIWSWKKGKWRNVSGGWRWGFSRSSGESTKVSDQVEYFR